MFKTEIRATNPTLRRDKTNFVNYLVFDNVGERTESPILKTGFFNVYFNIDNEAKQIVLVSIDNKTLINWVLNLEKVAPFTIIECEGIKVDFEDFKGVF